MFDAIFKAYADWTGAYFRGDYTEAGLKKEYLKMRDALPASIQKYWPV